MARWPKSWLATTPGRACSSCGRRTGRPIVWGLPSPEIFTSDEIDVALGGCVLTGHDPTHRCSNCGAEFGGRIPGAWATAAGYEPPPSTADLKEAKCWFPSVDTAPGHPAVTAFKRRARLHQASWREANGYPIGSQPIVGKPGSTVPKPVGSRVAYAFAVAKRVNLLTDDARQAADNRLANPEKFQTLNEQRLWADLLSSMPMCWNLFGPLVVDPGLAATATASWFPDAPGVPTVHLEWSPGRCDPTLLSNRTAFDAAIEVDRGADGIGIIGIETKYHEHPTPEKAPSAEKLRRYREVTERSGIFVDGAVERIVGTDLQQVWLDHLLACAMLQHPSGRWTWCRYVLVYPGRNPSFARLAASYRHLLIDDSTFEDRTIESFVDDRAPLPARLREPFTDRYLW